MTWVFVIGNRNMKHLCDQRQLMTRGKIQTGYLFFPNGRKLVVHVEKKAMKLELNPMLLIEMQIG